MAKTKACKACKSLFTGSKCPQCGSHEINDNFKGKIIILNPEESDIAQKLKLNKKGIYAIRI